MTEEVRLIIVGFGVVARSLADSLEARGEEFRRTRGIDFHLVAAVDSKSAAVDRNGPKALWRNIGWWCSEKP